MMVGSYVRAYDGDASPWKAKIYKEITILFVNRWATIDV